MRRLAEPSEKEVKLTVTYFEALMLMIAIADLIVTITKSKK